MGVWKFMYYAGIGSIDVPSKYHDLIKQFAIILSQNGYILRVSGENGSSHLFEEGCDEVHGKKEIYLPWKKYNGRSSRRIVKMHDAFVIAKKYHPNWSSLSPGGKKQMARYTHLVLGGNLKIPSSFVLCYFPSGIDCDSTNQVLRVANGYNVPIFNIGSYDDLNDCITAFSEFISKL